MVALGAIVKTAGKSLVKSQVKKVAVDKLMGRKKKKQPQQQGQSEVNGKSGGAIVKAPSSALANMPLADSVSTISQTSTASGGVGSGSDTILVIKTRVVEVEKILKGSVALDKKLQDQERKRREKALRAEEEKELETKDDKDDKKVKKKKSKVKLGFLDGLIKFVKDILMGFILVKMLDFLPQIQKLIPILGGVLDFITGTVIGIVDALGTFLMWGDKAIGGSKKFVENKFGEKGAKTFDAIVGTIGNLFNTIAILGMTAAAFGRESDRQSNKPRSKPRRKPNSLGDRARRMRRNLQTRAERATRSVRKTIRKIRPTNIKRVVQSTSGRIMKGARNLQQTGSNILQKVRPSNLKQTGSNLLKRASDVKGNLMQRGSNLMQRGSNLIKKGGNFFNRVGKGIGDFAKKQMANVDNIIGGIKAQGAEWAKKIGKNLKNMNPMKLGEKVKGLLKGKMDKIVKNNDLIKQVKNLNPKNAAKSIKGLLKTAKTNKNILQLRQGLKAAKAAKIGGVDAVIAAIMGVLDYAAFGESPINAILRAIGGLLGYTAGFAIGAPFGGAPGFITGMAGAFVGEFASKMIAKGLAKTKLGKIQDPIMNDGRMLVRDPDEKDEESTEKAKTEKKTTTTEIKSYSENPIRALSSGNRSRIEQALYEMRIKAGFGEGGYDYVGNPKYKGDVDLIMKHGLDKVSIDGGRVTLQKNLEKKKQPTLTPVDVNSVAAKTNSISKRASYEESGEEVVVVNSTTPSGGGNAQQNETMPVETASAGGGDDFAEALYEGG